ncbi:methionine--tRNA ligase [Dehalococcoidia bacterium]|nr:methionine--tRNA ligase [Dehalococcoidia bacterium]
MPQHILVAVAWPYANGPLHLGHIAGAYLPADVFARYHRLKGNHVLMVSGSDMHGTPITISAEREGISPEEVATRNHQGFLESWQKLGISFDLFTSTHTPNHAEVVHDIFLTLRDKGCIFKDTVPSAYCPQCDRYLPDRYLEGECPYCHFLDARGDQCDECGKTLSTTDLIGLRCSICGASPQIRISEHFFLRLSRFSEQLESWVRAQNHWRPNVSSFTLRYIEEGLRDRAITRDLEWGVSVPVPGFEKKRIYVWFEAVIGYLSASKEWAKINGDSELWRQFWTGDTRTYYFIGKDNIPFHTLIWPAILLGYEGLSLPYDVPANEFLTLEGGKFSTSRNWAVWLPDYLKRYDPDPLRYVLSVNMPETGDTDFSWREFVRRNNDELVATYGNLVHRVLSFTNRNFNGHIPPLGELDVSDNTLLSKARDTLDSVGEPLGNCRFKEAIKAAFSLAQEANRYLDEKAPWKVIKQDRDAAAHTVGVALGAVSCLQTVLYPFLPFSSENLHHLLGSPGSIEGAGWSFTFPLTGQALAPPEPLFTKLDEDVVVEETSRLGQFVMP